MANFQFSQFPHHLLKPQLRIGNPASDSAHCTVVHPQSQRVAGGDKQQLCPAANSLGEFLGRSDDQVFPREIRAEKFRFQHT